MDEIVLPTIQWFAPEYTHKEKSMDFIWTIGIVTLIACIIALWTHNNLFAVFIFVSGGCLILFSMRTPQEIEFKIETKGLSMGRDNHNWKEIKGFTILRDEPYAKLLVETSKKFLPIYTIPLPPELVDQTKETLLRVIPSIELHESPSMKFMEKLGF